MKRTTTLYIVFFLFIILSRLPFITTGYGSEEDAWGLRLTAESISRSGNYEVSRLPGHPLQEIIYALIWKQGFLLMNALTVLISTAGIFFFLRILRKMRTAAPWHATATLAFTPVIYINSANVMDYTWAMSFVLAAFYFLKEEKMALAGVLFGLAIACRITSGAMIVPFAIAVMLAGKHVYHRLIVLGSAVIITTLVCFMPVIRAYGFSFFTFYQHFPIPGIAKNIYKGTIGVWGLPLTIFISAVMLYFIYKFIRRSNSIMRDVRSPGAVICLTVIILYTIAFFRLPLKSAFMIPLVPFVILLISLYASQRIVKAMSVTALISCFTLGINLADARRGSTPSSVAFTEEISGQQVTFDVLKGPLQADLEKQKHIIAYSRQVLQRAESLEESCIIISGWYLNFINVLNTDQDPYIKFVYYIDEAELKNYIVKGVPVYFLSEQDYFNDLRFGISITSVVAKPFPL